MSLTQQEAEEIKIELQNDLLFDKYISIINTNYKNYYSATKIAHDISLIDKLDSNTRYAVSLNRGENERDNLWQVKLFKLNGLISLSRTLPVIENFGVRLLDEMPNKLKLDNNFVVDICDFGVQVPEALLKKLENKEFVANLQEALVKVFNYEIENDELNSLVLYSDLKGHDISLLRAVTHYLIQTSLPFSKHYICACLCRYPDIARKLFLMFEFKFNCSKYNISQVDQLKLEISKELAKVKSIDEDKILRAYLAVIDAMARTNYYQLNQENKSKEYISFKISSNNLNFLPKPKPLYEVFVYSRLFEAIHLRGGKVARGGLRWSDRREDFRTEVLGLVKAQMVKNAVIVPTGSKGGFVCKELPQDPKEYLNHGVMCYKNFIRGLLDITDNIVGGKIIPPLNVIRYDDDDPYLVVAADKGTASFSDYANEVSSEYNFWLNDAFASGGSVGYDHKKMGITARGAWESAKRHFRHLAIDTQAQYFTVLGIGDMSGDVFGNGMLLSKHIRLLAAFNHKHIFIDPSPDAPISFLERERLFNLGASSWSDYDIHKISKGGGVFSRTDKLIPISYEIKQLLNITEDNLSPNELIVAILKARADMFYNGGIGTYVKAETESHEEVKDKANDAIRINGNELQVKIVVEGGNLGVTQLGRIEFAKNGGYIYTDAIDNSAGVDCSDHEVNIKILFSHIIEHSNITLEQRNKILEEMTAKVAKLVLRDNYLQTQILRCADHCAKSSFTTTVNFIEKLEKLGKLDRKVEFLPNMNEVIDRQRADRGLTMPELSVLLSYSKTYLNSHILNSDIVDDISFESLLINYFPTNLHNLYLDNIKAHYLRREIIANELANLIVNRMGITFISRLEDESRAATVKIIRAFWGAYNILDAENIFRHIEALDNKVDANVQIEMLLRLKKSLERTTNWILCKFDNIGEINNLVLQYKNDVSKLIIMITTLLNNDNYPHIDSIEKDFIVQRVPESLAKYIARSNELPQLLDIVILSRETKCDLQIVANNYFYLGRRFRMDWLRKNLIALPQNNKWQALSRAALISDAYFVYTSFIRNAIKLASSSNDNEFGNKWISQETHKVEQINTMLDELQNYKIVDLAMLSAAIRELKTILS